MKSESELLFTEKRMNCTNTQTLTVASKQDLFQRERKYKAVSIDTEGGKCPEKVGRTAVYILTSIDLYTFDWFF